MWDGRWAILRQLSIASNCRLKIHDQSILHHIELDLKRMCSKGWNRQDARARSHWTGSNKVVIAYGLCTGKGRHSSIFCWLQEAQRSNCVQFLSVSTYEWVHRCIGRREDFLGIGCKQWLLASPNCQKSEGQNCVYVTSWIISFLPYSVWTENRTGHILTRNALHLVYSPLSVRVCLLRWHYDNFEKACRTISNTWDTSWRYTEMLASLSDCRSRNYSPILSTTWEMLFILDT